MEGKIGMDNFGTLRKCSKRVADPKDNPVIPKRFKVGADNRPNRGQNPKQKAQHQYPTMSVLMNLTTSDLTDSYRSTPCLVQLPTIRGLNTDALRARFPTMAQAKNGVFTIPLKPTPLLFEDLPSLTEEAKKLKPILESVYDAVSHDRTLKLIADALCAVDEGIEYNKSCSNFFPKEGHEYFPGDSVDEPIDEYGYRNTEKEEDLKTLIRELPTKLRDAIVNHESDKEGRTFWHFLLTQLAQLVQHYIAQDVSDYKQLKRAAHKRDRAAAALNAGRLDSSVTAAKLDTLKDLYDEADDLYNEIMLKKQLHVTLDHPLYVSDDFHIRLSAADDQYNVWYNYITHEMDEKAMMEWFKDASSQPPKDQNKADIFKNLADLMTDREAKWPWCKRRDNTDYCRIPNSHRKVDVTVLYRSEASPKTNHHSFTPALFLCEIQGPRLNPYGAILQEAAHTLVFIPKCFGMVVTRDEVEFMEFRRDPENSRIEIYSNKFSMTGITNESKSVGLDVCNIMCYIIRCLVYASLEDLPECLPHWKDLKADGFTLGKRADFPAQDTCKCCWHFRDYADLKRRYEMGAMAWVPLPPGEDPQND